MPHPDLSGRLVKVKLDLMPSIRTRGVVASRITPVSIELPTAIHQSFVFLTAVNADDVVHIVRSGPAGGDAHDLFGGPTGTLVVQIGPDPHSIEDFARVCD